MIDADKTRMAERASAAVRASTPVLTRRRLLAGTGQAALLAAVLPMACAPVINAPWADGTFWDDGKGWAD